MKVRLYLKNSLECDTESKIKVSTSNYESNFAELKSGYYEKSFPLKKVYSGDGLRITIIHRGYATMFKFSSMETLEKVGELYEDDWGHLVLKFDDFLATKIHSMKVNDYVNSCLPFLYTFPEALERDGKCVIM